MILPLFTDDIPEEVREVVAILYTFEEWTQDWSKDVELVQRMASLFPDLDLRAEALAFVTWLGEWRESHPRKEIKPRARFVSWCKNAKAWARRRPRPPAGKEAHRPTGLGGW